jgi:flagellar biosynthesis/type III secretory pathway protein FliH
VTAEISIPFSSSIREVVLAPPDASVLPSSSPGVIGPPVPAERAVDPQVEAEAERLRQEERAAIERTLHAMMEAARGLATERNQRRTEMQRATVELAVTIASRLIHERIEAGQFALEALVRKTIERLEPNQPVIVRLHPDDITLLERRLGKNQPLMPDGTEVRLLPDPGLERGACRAEAGTVGVLSQWKDQLEEIRQHLLRSVAHAQSEPRTAQS